MIKIIAKAWIQVLKQNTTEEHKRRADICKPCEYSSYQPMLDFINDELKEVKGLVCTDCGGCPLIAKIRSTVKCSKWE